MSAFDLESYSSWFSENEEKIWKEFFEFLRFKSTSADPNRSKDCEDCCAWLADMLAKIGLEVNIWKTEGQPVIFASSIVDSNLPTLLIYHHYDVQPEEPVDLWESDPFKPEIRDGNIYARGASDNKGQCYSTLCGLRAYKEKFGTFPINIKLVIEGEEEVGSPSFHKILSTKQKELSADYVAVIDTDMASLDQPTVTLGCRGITTMEFSCRACDTDLHSGAFGGIVYNPIRALCEAIDKCWNEDGRVAIPGFYDDVIKIDESGLSEDDLPSLVKKFGIRALHSEKGYTPVQCSWIRPTLEINGIVGGYTGPGFKTVLPATASCKISARLIGNQDAKKVANLIGDFLKKNLPSGMEHSMEILDGGGAFCISHKERFPQLVKKAYEDASKRPCGFVMGGGSVPIIPDIAKVVGGQLAGMGFALRSDAVHAPNEHFNVESFKNNVFAIAALLERLPER